MENDMHLGYKGVLGIRQDAASLEPVSSYPDPRPYMNYKP